MSGATLTRLFVAGWPAHLNEEAVVRKLGSFGRVVGPVSATRRGEDAFAHLTLEASQDSLDRCFKALNRSTWFSNVLRVERANEHYMERLSRESGGPDSTSADDWWGHDGSPPDKPPISQLRLSDTSLPRGKRRKNRILVSLGPNPSSSHSHFDEDGALVPNTGGEDVWSKEALGGRKKPPTVPGPDTVPHAAPTRTAPSDATDSDAAETVAVDHGYTRGDDGGAAVDEGQIDSMLADRMRAKSKRDYASADTLLADLKAIGVEVYDKTKEWKAVGLQRKPSSASHVTADEIQRLLREQGFADSSSDDDEDDRVADGTAIDGDNQALPSHSAERDQPRDAFDEAAAKEEKKKSMQLLSSMFGGPSDTGRTAQDTSEVEQHEGADEGARADPMYWHQTKRYDPTAADAAMLEMNPVPLEAAAGQAVPTPMPMVPSTKAYDMGTSRSIASLFTQLNPGAAEEAEAGFRMHGDDQKSPVQTDGILASGIAPGSALAGAMEAADAAAAAERLRSKFCLMFPSGERGSCRFMRTEPLEEVEEQWRNERELYTSDFKRRRKDAKRRTVNNF